MEKFLKVASPLALVAGMAGHAHASGPGEFASSNWITPPIVQSAPTASQPVWDDLSASNGVVEQAPEYEYPPAVAETTPLATPVTPYAQAPVTSATTSGCPHVSSPCGGVAPHPHPHHEPVQQYIPPAPVYVPPAPVYTPPAPVYQDRIVEKKVFVDRPIERKVIVNRPIYIDRPVYVPRPVPVIKRVPVPVDRPVYIHKRVAVPVVKHVAVPVDRPVYIHKRVAVPVVKPVAVPVDRPVYVQRPVPYPVIKRVPVDRPVYIDRPVHNPVKPGYSCGITLPKPIHTGGCFGHGAGYGHGIGYGHGAAATAASHTTPVINGGYEYYGNQGAVPASLSGYQGHGGLSFGDCCNGYTGGHQYGYGAALSHGLGGEQQFGFGGGHYGQPSKHAFKHAADQIAQASARIADAENAKVITAAKASTLRQELQKTSNVLTAARRDGQFEEKEIEVVAASVRQLSEQMGAAKKSAELAKTQQEAAEQYAKAFAQGQGFGGHHGIEAASFGSPYGAAGAYMPGAQFPGLSVGYGGFGGGFGGFGGFSATY